MASHMEAKKNPVFKWFYTWVPLGDDGTPREDLAESFAQPATTRVRFDVPDGRSTRSVYVDIVPDKAMHGPEFPMHFTFDQFQTKIVPLLDETRDNFGRELFRLMGMCMQGQGLQKWQIAAAKHPVETRTPETFKECQADYLEEVAKQKKLGNGVIRMLRMGKKPAGMPYTSCEDRRDELKRHLDSGLLRYTSSRATNEEDFEQLFDAQPLAHQNKWAEKEEEVGTDAEKLRTHFKGCHQSDVAEGPVREVGLVSPLEMGV